MNKKPRQRQMNSCISYLEKIWIHKRKKYAIFQLSNFIDCGWAFHLRWGNPRNKTKQFYDIMKYSMIGLEICDETMHN